MKKLNKKAFTLVELLAVIVVLAIIMVIAFGSVNRLIENTRKKAFISTYNLVVKSIQEKIKLGDEDTIAQLVCDDYNACATKYGIDVKEYSLLVKKDASNNIIPAMTGAAGGKFEDINITNSDIESKYSVYNGSEGVKDGYKNNSIAVKINSSNGSTSKLGNNPDNLNAQLSDLQIVESQDIKDNKAFISSISENIKQASLNSSSVTSIRGNKIVSTGTYLKDNSNFDTYCNSGDDKGLSFQVKSIDGRNKDLDEVFEYLTGNNSELYLSYVKNIIKNVCFKSISGTKYAIVCIKNNTISDIKSAPGCLGLNNN